jgi:hypothetical protein
MEWITCVAALFHAFPILVQSASAPTSLDAHGLTILVLGQPWMEGNEVLNKCSDADWKEYVGSMGKFSSLVTEAVHSLELGVELKMPDGKYKDIPPNQTGFAKAAVDRYACARMVVHARFK